MCVVVGEQILRILMVVVVVDLRIPVKRYMTVEQSLGELQMKTSVYYSVVHVVVVVEQMMGLWVVRKVEAVVRMLVVVLGGYLGYLNS